MRQNTFCAFLILFKLLPNGIVSLNREISPLAPLFTPTSHHTHTRETHMFPQMREKNFIQIYMHNGSPGDKQKLS